MKRFKLYWLDGKTEVVSGRNIDDAFNKAGYGAGALRALDYYEPLAMGGEDDEYFVGDYNGTMN